MSIEIISTPDKLIQGEADFTEKTLNLAEEWIDDQNITTLIEIMISYKWIIKLDEDDLKDMNEKKIKELAKDCLYEDKTYVGVVIHEVMHIPLEVEIIDENDDYYEDE